MIYRRNLGPQPCQISDLNLSKITENMNNLTSNEVINKARECGKLLEQEDGATKAVETFYRHLPVDAMLCDVSIFNGQAKLAQVKFHLYPYDFANFVLIKVYCHDCDMKLCSEVSDFLHVHNKSTLSLGTIRSISRNRNVNTVNDVLTCNETENNANLEELDIPFFQHSVVPYRYKSWNLINEPKNPSDGLIQGLQGLVNEVTDGVGQAFYQPVQGYIERGITGGARGLRTGLIEGILTKPIQGGTVFLKKLALGIRNSIESDGTYTGGDPQSYSQSVVNTAIKSNDTSTAVNFSVQSMNSSDMKSSYGKAILQLRSQLYSVYHMNRTHKQKYEEHRNTSFDNTLGNLIDIKNTIDDENNVNDAKLNQTSLVEATVVIDNITVSIQTLLDEIIHQISNSRELDTKLIDETSCLDTVTLNSNIGNSSSTVNILRNGTAADKNVTWDAQYSVASTIEAFTEAAAAHATIQTSQEVSYKQSENTEALFLDTASIMSAYQQALQIRKLMYDITKTQAR